LHFFYESAVPSASPVFSRPKGNPELPPRRLGFLLLAVPALAIAWLVHRLPEPARGGADRLQPGQQHIGVPPTDGADSQPDSHPGTETARIRDLIRETNIAPREHLVLDENPGDKSLLWAVGYVLRIPTNLVLIVASALGYYFFAGIRTFGVEFMTGWFHLSHSGALWVTAGLGGGALIGVLFGGRLADSLLAHRILSARVLVATIAYLVAAVLLLPALRTHLLPVAAPSRSTGRFSSCSSSSSSAAASASSLSAPTPATSPPPKPTPAVRRNGTGTPEPALPRFRFLPRSLRGIG
jgi:hypothetical protein